MIRRAIPSACIAAALSTLFVLFFSTTTSPLNPQFGSDSSIFRLIGTAMANGQLLYVDVWDHKGPGLFLIQWLAQEIWGGRVGIFLLQIIFLTCSLWLFGAIARRFVHGWLVVVAQLSFLALLAPTYEYGNLSEEWSLPFSMFVLWGLTRAWHQENIVVPNWVLAVSGAALAFVFFIRLNNAAAILAAFTAYFIYVLLKKLPFWRQLGIAVSGFLMTCAVFIGGFAIFGALPEMLHGTFIYNFAYASDAAADPRRLFSSGYLIVGLGLCLLTVIGGLIDAQKRKRPWYLVLTIALTIVGLGATMTAANAYFHYLQLLVPGAAIGVVLTLQLFTGKIRSVAGIIGLGLTSIMLLGFGKYSLIHSQNSGDEAFASQISETLQHVPESQRDEVFTWNVDSRYHLITDSLPMHRFYTLQDWWGRSDPTVYQELNEYFDKTPPEWLVTNTAPIADTHIAEIVAQQYREVSRTNNLLLLQRIEPTG